MIVLVNFFAQVQDLVFNPHEQYRSTLTVLKQFATHALINNEINKFSLYGIPDYSLSIL
jgi:hypothetical protein